MKTDFIQGVTCTVSEFEDHCTFQVAAGSTGYGAPNDKSRTVLQFQDLASTDFHVEIDGERIRQVSALTIVMRGDAELRVLTQSLRAALTVLENAQKGFFPKGTT